MDETPQIPQPLLDYLRSAPIPLALGAAELPDEPLIEVNAAFCKLTGYGRDEAVGRNCRFLQRGEEALEARAKMRAFLDDEGQEAGRFEVPNMRKDGTHFTNLIFMSRLRARRAGQGLIFASQFDLDRGRSRAEAQRYDIQLGAGIDQVSEIAQNFGLMMRQSTELLSQSAATIARIKFDG
ncbi:PAS domain-containing protein [Limimaricola pyoseonensis]|uniref:PAS domain S-box-containing protein n=1 Tax=Limimaricola pyoseonensis TaxID=521013 RepID=A0A1G6ZPE4_9RHOB|nr:PAS domain-containing protein [Limimaricola pyoseonensis]SDE04263.1 PAS domain S-box-containing protein [Limimaricola pyoseonensis]